MQGGFVCRRCSHFKEEEGEKEGERKKRKVDDAAYASRRDAKSSAKDEVDLAFVPDGTYPVIKAFFEPSVPYTFVKDPAFSEILNARGAYGQVAYGMGKDTLTPLEQAQRSKTEKRGLRHLHMLELEESLYLAHKGKLVVVTHSTPDKPMEVDEMLAAFRAARKSVGGAFDFCLRYAAYAYLKDKGWVAKSGSWAGSTFALYVGSPDEVHSSHIVHMQDDSPQARGPGSVNSKTWLDILAISRVAETVSKSLVIIGVKRKVGHLMADDDRVWQTCEALDDIEVDSIVLRRWDPTKGTKITKMKGVHNLEKPSKKRRRLNSPTPVPASATGGEETLSLSPGPVSMVNCAPETGRDSGGDSD